jgi:hypothetical protein
MEVYEHLTTALIKHEVGNSRTGSTRWSRTTVAWLSVVARASRPLSKLPRSCSMRCSRAPPRLTKTTTQKENGGPQNGARAGRRGPTTMPRALLPRGPQLCRSRTPERLHGERGQEPHPERQALAQDTLTSSDQSWLTRGFAGPSMGRPGVRKRCKRAATYFWFGSSMQPRVNEPPSTSVYPCPAV